MMPDMIIDCEVIFYRGLLTNVFWLPSSFWEKFVKHAIIKLIINLSLFFNIKAFLFDKVNISADKS